MMYKTHYIRALAQSARIPVARFMRPDTINESRRAYGHADMRAIFFVRALSQLVHSTRVTESFLTICGTLLDSSESKSIIQLSISGAHRGTRCLAAGS